MPVHYSPSNPNQSVIGSSSEILKDAGYYAFAGVLIVAFGFALWFGPDNIARLFTRRAA